MPDSTARLDLPVPVETDTPDVPRDITNLAGRLDESVNAAGYREGVAWYMQGTTAQRPAAGIRGRFYESTDGGVIYYDDGSAWDPINATANAAFTDTPGSSIFQEGVVNPGEGVVTRLLNSAIRVAAGNAWIDGDGVVGSGRYPCSWVQTDLTGIPAAGAGVSRVDRVIARLQGQYGAVPTIERLAGGEAAGQSLDTRNLAVAIPAGCLHLADVLVDNTGVVATAGIRSRRTFSGGWNQVIRRESNGSGTDDYFSSSGTWVDVGGLLFPVYAEVKPGHALTATLEAMMQGGTVLIQYQISDSDLNVQEALSGEVHVTDLAPDGSSYFSMRNFRMTNVAGAVPLAGETSVREAVNMQWAPGAAGGRLIARNQAPVSLLLKEHLAGPTFANTKDH